MNEFESMVIHFFEKEKSTVFKGSRMNKAKRILRGLRS